MRSKTKQQIVETARKLFNEKHYGRVTTALLANQLNMTEGNLWYHFKTKRDLLDAIQQDFVALIKRRRELLEHDLDPVELYIAYLITWMDDISDYLFMYRDQADYGDHSPALREQLPGIYREVRSQFEAIFTRLADAGILKMDEGDWADMILNIMLIVRFYLEFMREFLNEEDAQSISVSNGLIQHLTLLKGRLAPEIIERIESEIREYDQSSQAQKS